MEELEKVKILRLVKGDDRGNVVRPEGGITAVDDALEVCCRDLRVRDVQGEDLVSQLLEGVVPPFGLPIGGKRGNFFRNEKTAV